MSAASITATRRDIGLIVANEASARRRDVLVFALDGIPLDIAMQSWPNARVSPRTAVFPTTSSTGWLSSLTGLEASAHGVPGVVFQVDGVPVNVLAHQGSLGESDAIASQNIFSDARALGYAPVALLSDWTPFPGAFRDLLLRHAQTFASPTFYAEKEPTTATSVLSTLASTLERVRRDARDPCLVWCFVDVDCHVHRFGYDEHVLDVLRGFDTLASQLAQTSVVVAHSDHGLVPTVHVPEIVEAIDAISRKYGASVGGAGRARWLHLAPPHVEAARRELTESLAGTAVSVLRTEEIWPAGGLSARRAGALWIVAEGTHFIAPPGYAFEHGSRTTDEIMVPFATWSS